MKTIMEMRMGQRGAMTPQLVQSIRLLQLSGLELEQEASQWLETNPMLEVEDDDEQDVEIASETLEVSQETPWEGSQTRQCSTQSAEEDEDPGRYEVPEAPIEAIHVQLLRELPIECSNAAQLEAAVLILDHVDERGYLETDLERIGTSSEVSLRTLKSALTLIQRLAPAGYATRTLEDCFLAQLKSLPASARRRLAEQLVSDHLESLARHEYEKVRQELGVTQQLFAQALELIRQLDPAPGRQCLEASHVVPDLILACRGGHWTLELNPNASPKLRVNAAYERMLSQCGAEGASMRQQLTEARWLLRGMSMRNETLLKTARAIFQHQFAAVIHGEAALKPLSIRDLSMQIEMHESTVSRVTQGKYVQTPRGIVELRRFFSVSLNAERGLDASSSAVRALIKSMIAVEPAGKPLCDGQITRELARRGVYIARRTVAKYRDQMHIPPAKMRAAFLPTAAAA